MLTFSGKDFSVQIYAPCWTIAIFAARETVATLTMCVQSALYACEGNTTRIDILVNGNKDLADEMAALINYKLIVSPLNSVRVWFVPFGDKAHTWNEYIYKIWEPCVFSYFIDGYTLVRSDAFTLLAEGLERHPFALGATGVPTVGRTATALRNHMLKDGGIHGNLFAIRGSAVASIRECQFRLPLGLYRTDGLIGAALMFRLDPFRNNWDTTCVFVHNGASWDVKNPPRWTINNFIIQWKRRLRQAQGEVENRAVREHLAINRLALAMIPSTVNELVKDWVDNHRLAAMRLFLREPLALYAVLKLRKPRDWAAAKLLPVLMETAVLFQKH